MKKLIIAATIGVFVSVAANAAGNVGQCVWPKSKVAKNGRLELVKPVYYSEGPNETSRKTLLQTGAYSIGAEAKGGYIQLLTVPDWDKPDRFEGAGKVVGWARLSDFQFQDLRNCN